MAALMENCPLSFVLVPLVDPCTTTEISGKGFFPSSVTVPEIVFICASEQSGQKSNTYRSLSTNKGTLVRRRRVCGISNQFMKFI
jgi:hypothetical protein